MDTIEYILKKTGLFPDLTKEEFDLLLSKVELIEIPSNSIFIYEGDKANSLFVIMSGSAQIYFQDDFKNQIELKRLEKGDFFGEQSLISIPLGIRNASVKSISNLSVLKVPHTAFKELVGNKIDEKLREIGFQQIIMKFRKRSIEFDFSKYFFDSNRNYIDKSFGAGEIIVNEGDEADGVYFIISGNVDIFIKGDLISSLSSGTVFGEIGVIKQQPRMATVKARNDVKVIFMPAKEFLLTHKAKSEFHSMMDTVKRTGRCDRGDIHQINGIFLGLPALITHFFLKDGRHLIASWVEGSTMRSIIDPKLESTEIITYSKDQIFRQLHVSSGRLIGVSVYGPWNELEELYMIVLDNGQLSRKVLDDFKHNGELNLPKTISEDMACNCMCLKKSLIEHYIDAGNTDVREIIRKTGAGTVCGGCIRKLSAF